MSFSVNARAASKDELREAINDKLEGVTVQQSAHKADRDLAQDMAGQAIDMLDDLPKPPKGEDDTHEYSVTVTGSLGWDQPIKEGETPDAFTSVNMSVNASILAKPTA